MKKIGDWWFPDAETLMVPEIERHGTWHPHRLAAALELLPRVGKDPDRLRTVLDAGAHVGTWTAEFAKRATRVIACEPTPTTYECLVENTRYLHNVQAHNLALADRVRYVLPGYDDRHGVGNSGGCWMRDVSAMEELPTGAVLAATVDGFGLEDLDVLKIDVEGMEPFVIRGAKDTIKRCKPLIIWENKPILGRRYGWAEANGPRFLLAKLGATCLLDAHGKDEVWGFPP